MTTEHSQDALLDDLRQYLQATDFAHLNAIEQPDLTTLFSDLAGLKTEIKAESRQFRATLDTLNEAVEILKTDNQVLTAQLAANEERLRQQRRDVERTMLLELIDVHDRLSEACKALQNYRPIDSWFKHSQKQDVRFIDSVRQGQEITLKRLEQSLQRRRVFAIECVGRPFDARTMTTIAIGNDPEYENAVVLEELRKGFLFDDQVLRLADVKVNKL
ncbi:MAG: nucleotide exchange factor GrpE [Methylomonas sp.]|nr:nucleotide exchange factor GrpE [Methylomonas sp.]PPD22943.1 MAG: nucleotide exchange factor GrpE [Methylomonas sp.]PPD23682.1 MAG: nucleotide exchange factor GrpE [Methylomonas sp.]PPD31587.1 MAG: nucleotide exchange factor GrpE [Methylomonas sp.]PPD41937.1 MAG: nucleotide exchange factor GrpE [Methylomonas sp.]